MLFLVCYNREDLSKNHQGGLKYHHVKPKEVRHFANQDKPSRCFIRLFRLYLTKLHPDSPKSAFYFKPLTEWSQTGIWFTKQPLGLNTLEHMMVKMCAKAQIQGYKTNHSLRATAASRLYHKGIDEQLITWKGWGIKVLKVQDRIKELMNNSK